MNLDELFIIQKQYDEDHLKNTPFDQKSIVAKKILALQVSIGNLANHTNCCDLLGGNCVCDKSLILSEYTKCFKYILSIGHSFNVTNLDIKPQRSKYSLENQFLNIFIDINDLAVFRSRDQFETLLEAFLSLGSSLEISFATLCETYIAKLSNAALSV